MKTTMVVRRSIKNIWLLLKDSAIAWDDDNVAQQGAALSFFTAFSLTPLAILVILLSSVGFGREAASGHLVAHIRGLIGTEGAQFVQNTLSVAYRADSNVAAALFSGVLLLLGSTAAFIQLRDSLNMIWRVEQKPVGTIRGFVRVRLRSFVMILGIGFLMIVSLALSALLSAASGFLSEYFVISTGVVLVTDLFVSFTGVTVLFVFLFKFLPSVVLQWSDAWIGAAVTSFLFSIGKYVIGLYLGSGSVGSAFGAASSLAVVLLWMYYSSQIVLYRAEFTRLYAKRFGTAIIPDGNAAAVVRRKTDR